MLDPFPDIKFSSAKYESGRLTRMTNVGNLVAEYETSFSTFFFCRNAQNSPARPELFPSLREQSPVLHRVEKGKKLSGVSSKDNRPYSPLRSRTWTGPISENRTMRRPRKSHHPNRVNALIN